MGKLFGYLFVFFLAQSLFADEVFRIRPFVFSEKGNQLVIGWSYHPDITNGTGIQVFRGNKAIADVQIEQKEDYFYARLPIGNCGYGNEISYQVWGMSAPEKINNIPCKHDSGSVNFSFIADTQEGPELAREFADKMLEFPADFWLHGGDLVQTGSDENDWKEFFWALEPVNSQRPMIATVGNHEYRGSKPLWSKYLLTPEAETHFDFYSGPVHIIVINSCFEDDKTLVQNQRAWIEQKLAEQARWKIVLFHHPPYSHGLAHVGLAIRREHIDLQNLYVPLFEAYKVDVVVNGHTHLFERSTKNGVEYITAGAAGGKMGWFGGSSQYTWKSEQIRTVTNFEVSHDHLRAVSVELNGHIVDNLQMEKK